ncbi:MAG: transcriptional regulator [Actinobacteria bacterium BACL15 MAG-120619-bin91]|uniref:Transcriptional regulator n=1 Tax=Actinobacteria bacterium BACL15 MAG-120619-bin91 TaxID=1655562 RepID=A0A0R2PEU8_9ACTN|nr:MAG: transcriptional regulator [Actinobacteria bacterium BACL15 MAG-120619-bin91]
MKSTRAIRIITSLSVGVVLVSAFSWLGLGQINGAINRIDAFSSVSSRPDKPNKALNYLLVGSDTREGLTREQMKLLRVGSTKTAAGSRSDTMLLVHISKSRDKATIISIPRDSLVTIPEHPSSVDKTKIVPAAKGKINAAFAFGGAPLLIQTIEDETGVRIDHYIEIGFAGFAGMVDALGGIEVCTKRDIDDPGSHLVLPAGVHTLNGVEALKYVRTRDFDGMGDLGRMQRQQQFMSAVLRKVTSTGVLLNPIKLVNFFNAAIATVKTDSELNKSDLLTLAKQMKNLSSSNVRTLTIPLGNVNARVPGVGSVVTWDSELAPDLFNRIREDLPLTDEVTPTPSASSSTTPKPTVIDKFKTRTADENPCGALK